MQWADAGGKQSPQIGREYLYLFSNIRKYPDANLLSPSNTNQNSFCATVGLCIHIAAHCRQIAVLYNYKFRHASTKAVGLGSWASKLR